MRKRRSDRNHVLYRLTFSDGKSYIGLTVADGRAFLRSVKIRVQKHMSRSKCETKEWNLYTYLRENSDIEMQYEVLEVVRGRKNAHSRERELIAKFSPELNTF